MRRSQGRCSVYTMKDIFVGHRSERVRTRQRSVRLDIQSWTVDQLYTSRGSAKGGHGNTLDNSTLLQDAGITEYQDEVRNQT